MSGNQYFFENNTVFLIYREARNHYELWSNKHHLRVEGLSLRN
jgi:hypothetical protein